jgi:hypothetical protein
MSEIQNLVLMSIYLQIERGLLNRELIGTLALPARPKSTRQYSLFKGRYSTFITLLMVAQGFRYSETMRKLFVRGIKSLSFTYSS